MLYCADTWFLLQVFKQNQNALTIMKDVREGNCSIIIPLTVYGETVKKLFQAGKTVDQANELFESLENTKKIQIVPLNKTIAIEAAKISVAYSLSITDAFVAATSKVCGCHALLSGDSDFLPLTKKYIKIRYW